jgi:hypothetical protein
MAARRFWRSPRITVLGVDAVVADRPLTRLLGLALQPAGPPLLIPRCSSVHTFGMRFAIDVVVLSWPGLEPLARHPAVPPRRVVRARRPARTTALLELPLSDCKT